MRVGLDFHGVIDTDMDFFSVLTMLLVRGRHEVHIVTGVRKSDFLRVSRGLHFTHFYSITDDFLKKGMSHYTDEKGNPCFDIELWNRAKAEYCSKNKIDVMIDNSDIYGRHFMTPYFHFRRER